MGIHISENNIIQEPKAEVKYLYQRTRYNCSNIDKGRLGDGGQL